MEKSDISGIKVRLQFLLDEKNITVYKLAKDIEINDSVIYDFLQENNHRNLSLDMLGKISNYFEVSLFWLIKGYSFKERNKDV